MSLASHHCLYINCQHFGLEYITMWILLVQFKFNILDFPFLLTFPKERGILLDWYRWNPKISNLWYWIQNLTCLTIYSRLQLQSLLIFVDNNNIYYYYRKKWRCNCKMIREFLQIWQSLVNLSALRTIMINLNNLFSI